MERVRVWIGRYNHAGCWKKKQKGVNSELSGDSLNQVEGVGCDQPLEKQ